LAAAGVRRGLVLLRTGKWDVPVALDPVAADLGMALAYQTTPGTPSVAHTLDLAWPFVADARVVVGFPDILLSPREAFADTLAHQEATGAELVLGCFPTGQPEKTDMVELAPDGTVRRLVIKQPDCGLRWTWSLAVWTPRFGAFLHAAAAGALPSPVGRELYLGEVIGAVVTAGWRVETVCFPGGSYLDIGTPDDLARAGGSALRKR
jgi:glucose-1-phosphate thymidylyltransferase